MEEARCRTRHVPATFHCEQLADAEVRPVACWVAVAAEAEKPLTAATAATSPVAMSNLTSSICLTSGYAMSGLARSRLPGYVLGGR